jgi:hypothetical protein
LSEDSFFLSTRVARVRPIASGNDATAAKKKGAPVR